MPQLEFLVYVLFMSLHTDERNPPPMFYGRIPDQVFYDNGQVYTFSDVKVNQGGNYDTTTGKFTCGPNGWYFFTFSIYGYGEYSFVSRKTQLYNSFITLPKKAIFLVSIYLSECILMKLLCG